MSAAPTVRRLGGTAPSSPRSTVPVITEVTEIAEIPVIEMVEPMPGFPDLRQFTLVRLDETGVLSSLSSVEDPSLRFLVVPPQVFFPDYAPEIDDATATSLGLERAEDALLLVVVNPGDAAGTATANLLAPVLVNVVTRQGGQVVLDEDLPIRAPLLA
jgi:flagellar assembly factor FliW